jgi:hypothetical protein
MVALRDQVLPGPDVTAREVVVIGMTFVIGITFAIAAIVSAVGDAVLNTLGPDRPHER